MPGALLAAIALVWLRLQYLGDIYEQEPRKLFVAAVEAVLLLILLGALLLAAGLSEMVGRRNRR
jgi:hypothetical protein